MLKAQVHNGRLVLDEPTELPDVEKLTLQVADDGDSLNEEERTTLHVALEQSVAQAQSGMLIPAEAVMNKLGTNQ